MSVATFSLHDLARQFIDKIHEIPGNRHDHFIQWCHGLCRLGYDQPDELAWCSSFMNGMALIVETQMTRSAAARSWLAVGIEIPVGEARVGNDIVILRRGPDPQPGPEVIDAPGHVGVFSGYDGDGVWVIGGNQSNGVTRQWFSRSKVLGIRRLGGQ